MTTQIKRRRGTTTQHASFTGAEGELTIDTTKDTVVVHDGTTSGGHPLAKESAITGKVDKAGDTMTGDLTVPNVITSGNVDGRDVSVDGTKLDGIEAGATADQTAAEIKTAYESNANTNEFSDAEQTKLAGIAASADVTDTANVTAAGALMDSEVTNLAQVKAFDTTDYATAAQGTLAASAVQPNDSAALKELDLNAIASTISDTAVDVFVYDTSKDSDGGAWRKRTQGTSWYNETLNTATRGSRKEFPAVAVIVAEAAKVTIYDGDDPDLPMWMVFSNISGNPIGGSGVTSAAARNGKIAWGHSSLGISYSDFIADTIYRHRAGNAAYNGFWLGGVSTRKETVSSIGWEGTAVSSSKYIVNNTVNDVAMTVLPNAPIDAATGLPVPTIAVATDGGVSVIKDDGTVVDFHPSAATSKSNYVDFEGSVLLVNIGTTALTSGLSFTVDVSSLTSDVTNLSNGDTDYVLAGALGFGSGSLQPRWINNQIRGHAWMGKNTLSRATTAALQLYHTDKETGTNETALMNYITSTYNTGWMNGAIKLATLSDTDDTDVTGSELVTNGTFDTDTSGWTLADASGPYWSSIGVVGGVLQGVTDGGLSTGMAAWQDVTTVVGKTYVATLTGTASTNRNFGFYINGTEYTTGGQSTPSVTATFVANSTTTTINLRVRPLGTDTTFTFDNISVRLAEEDRSVNGNGLQVFGTVTKNPVATGADLVAYSGFSASNYLEQPYNANIAVANTVEQSITLWMKKTGTAQQCLFSFGDTNTAGGERALFISVDGKAKFVNSGSSTELNAVRTDLDNGGWHQVVICIDSASQQRIFVDGTLDHNGTLSLNSQPTNSKVVLGKRGNNSLAATDCTMALFRVSNTRLSPEQIKKIYEDEKVLFQENAQATLYGSSDAVTALAYDDTTELLHVGTSAGRSVFQGLRRVDNTTDAVGAAISASNGLVAED